MEHEKTETDTDNVNASSGMRRGVKLRYAQTHGDNCNRYLFLISITISGGNPGDLLFYDKDKVVAFILLGVKTVQGENILLYNGERQGPFLLTKALK